MDSEIVADSIAQYYRTKSKEVETVHVLLDQHWPLEREKTREHLQAIAKQYGCLYIDSGRNRGLHEGFNYALSQLTIPDNAMVIGYDPDSYPVTIGWDMAMCEVFVADPRIQWLSLWHQHATRQLLHEGAGMHLEMIHGHRVRQVSRAVMNSVCGFRMGWLRRIGGLYEVLPKYGGLEVHMWPKIDGRWVFLEDFQEQPALYDRMNPLYKEWKWRTAHLGEPQIDFGEWLKLSRPTQ